MSKKIRGLIALAIISASMTFSTGCGTGSTGKEAASAPENDGNAGEDNVAQSEEGAENGADAAGSAVAGQSENLDSLLGEWVKIASMGEGYYSSAVDIESEGTLDIYVEDGYYKVDYVENENVYGEYYGIKIYEVEKPDYRGNDAAPWYAQFTRRKAPNVVHDIALIDKDVIKLHIHYSYSYQEEETGETIEDIYDSYEVYARKDSANIDDIILKYRYNNTVNVSNIRELYEAISDNTRIILEAGTYNISQLPFEKRQNDKINYVYNDETWDPVFYNRDTICVTSVNNLKIEAKEGANVTICTEDAYEAPLSFDCCNNVTLSGLTLGHQVEPGSCSGAVVLLNDTNVVNIENCRLYGCGTYGIEADYSHNMNINDTEIYECTYGLVNLFHTDNVTFRNCSMHDSTGFDMIDLQNVRNILFDGCNITDNFVYYDTSALIDSIGDDVKFTNCHFDDNSYVNFKFGDADFENCSISD